MSESRSHPLTWVAIAAALVPAGVAYAAMLGLGLHRHAPAWSISLAATGMVFGPALLAGAFAPKRRSGVFAMVLAVWSLALLVGMPVYFPDQRRQAVATGIALVGLGEMAQEIADRLPDEPILSAPEVPEAATMVEVVPPAPIPLAEDEIALPYEGAGRRLSVPVVFEHEGVEIETWMMLDTGATYTTLPISVLKQLGAAPDEASPRIQLHTANGDREAEVVLVDKVWLGNLSIEGVAIATCDLCASAENVGLLGLNVSGGYNLYIDADRREVVFTSRPGRDDRLDVSPFTELSASFTRYPGGRVEVTVRMENKGTRHIDAATAAITCAEGDASWTAELQDIPGNSVATVRRRLPPHNDCGGYRISLDAASW